MNVPDDPDPSYDGGFPKDGVIEDPSRKPAKNNAATGASAAGVRALSAQVISFYFRAPVKAFFRTRVDYLAPARAINPRVQANEGWSWRVTTPGLLAHAVKTHGWSFIPNNVLPPLLANATVGAVLYTTYLQTLGALHSPAATTTKRLYPPPPPTATFTAGFLAGSVQSLIAAPLDALQVRFQASDMLEGRYSSIWGYSASKLREIGLRGVFAGWSLSLCKDAFGYGVFFSTFEYVKAQAYYAFVKEYYAHHVPQLSLHQPTPSAQPGGSRPDVPSIRPHYALEPTFLMLAGVCASVAQQTILHPLDRIQDAHLARLESLDYLAKLEHRAGPREAMRAYYHAYRATAAQCAREAQRAGGWRRYLYGGFVWNTLRQVPSTSAGLVIFELVRRRYGTGAKEVRIEGKGFDVLLS